MWEGRAVVVVCGVVVNEIQRGDKSNWEGNELGRTFII